MRGSNRFADEGVSAFVVSMACLALCGVASSAHADAPNALFWAPRPAPSSAPAVRKIVAHALADRGVPLDDAPIVEHAEASLHDALTRAIDEYRALHLDVAMDALQRIAVEAARTGGSDLDRRGLGDLFLYLALVQQERGHNDEAWDAFVSAARLDPTRTLDPARVPPRAAAAFKRAVAEQSRSAQVDVIVRLPGDARLRIDGESQHLDATPLRLPAGPHYVQVQRDGDEPWLRTVTFAPPELVLAPALTPEAPPDLDALVSGRSKALLAALYRPTGDAPFRLLVRARSTEGRLTEASDVLTGDLEHHVAALVEAALGPLPVVLVSHPVERVPVVRRWWLWTAVGVSAAALAIGLSVGLTRSGGTSLGSVGGKLVPVK